MAPEKYSLEIRFLHWLMAFAFFAMWGIGWYMTEIVTEDSTLEDILFDTHISIGVSLIVLLALRIYFRLKKSQPEPASSLSKWESIGSHIGHIGLYALPALIILTGWAETNFGGHTVTWIGISMPKLFPTLEMLGDINLEEATSTLHKWLAYSMLGLALIHIIAAFKHRFEGHDVLNRMSFGSPKSKQ